MRRKSGFFRRYSSAVTLSIQVLDAMVVLGAGLLACRLRFGDWFIPTNYAVLLAIGELLAVLLFSAAGLYHSWRGQGGLASAGRAFGAWCVTFFILLLVLVAYKKSADFSRAWLGLWFAFTVVMLLTTRIAGYGMLRFLRRRGANSRNLVIVGDGNQALELEEEVTAASEHGFRITAVFGNGNSPTEAGQVPSYLTQFRQFITSNTVDEIWVALPLERSAELRHVLAAAQDCMANIRYVPDFSDLFLLNHGVSEIMGMPMLDLSASPMYGLSRLLKELEDKVLALMILLLISPVMLAVGVAVRLDSSGPVIFSQRRNGWDGSEIWIYKFRTMREHAEQGNTVTQATRNDSRLTRIGAFLRSTSLDELPQFINVLQGRMSIVGPRPHAIEHNTLYRSQIEHYTLRHKVKPGITGWAQINGLRGQTDTVDKMKKRVDYDFYYIENWSLWFDLKIILLTVLHGFADENAY